jgi:hypothetical protein
MSKKSKTSEMNDIIDSSYAEPDYSYDNDYYDNVDNRRYRNTNTNTNTDRSSNDNPFSKVTTIRPPASITSTPTSNIFMKYTGGSKTNTENLDKSVMTPKSTEIKNTEDEFPSLGGSKKPVLSVSAPAAMNFKKIVETKKPLEFVEPQVAQIKTKPKSNANYYKSYEELKYYSEKIAKSRIHRGAYSDDEDDDMDDDMDDNYYDDE